MPQITATTTPVFFATRYSSEVYWSGLLEVGHAIAAGYELITGDTEASFLAAAVDKAGDYKPLPTDTTAWLEAGEIYGYNKGLVIIRQSHYRTIYPPEDTPALISVYRADAATVLPWVANEKVYRGTRRTYADKTWECLQDHVTQEDWTPPLTQTLWKLYVVVVPEADWAYPVAYKVGDIVKYLGIRYQCLQAHTSQAGWTPAAVPALWRKL